MKNCMNITAKRWTMKRVAAKAARHDRAITGCEVGQDRLANQPRYGLTSNWTPGKQVTS